MSVERESHRIRPRRPGGTLKPQSEGNGDAQMSIAMMYDSGDGVEQNDQEAIRWYRKVIEHGDQAATVAEYSIQRDPAEE